MFKAEWSNKTRKATYTGSQPTNQRLFKQGGVTGSVWAAYPFKDTLRKVWAMLLLLLLAPLS